MADSEAHQSSGPTVSALQRALDSLAETFRPLSESVSGATARLSSWYAEHEDAIIETLQNLTFIGVAATRPENWQDLDAGELLQLNKVAIHDQLCLVWVPRAQTVRDLLAQHDRDQRQIVLLARRAEILDDCELILSVTSQQQEPIHAVISGLALKAIAAAHDGHDEAAQAFGGSVLSAVIHDMLGFERQAEARRVFADTNAEDDLRLFMLRETVLYGATARVLARTSDGLTGFNRHATAHGHLGSFESADMLEAVMLISAWLREITFRREQILMQTLAQARLPQSARPHELPPTVRDRHRSQSLDGRSTVPAGTDSDARLRRLRSTRGARTACSPKCDRGHLVRTGVIAARAGAEPPRMAG